MGTLNEKLLNIQAALKAPKAQRNNFGKYNYRSQEDILEAVKPLLKEQGLTLVVSDDVIEVAGMVVINATATIFDGEDSVAVAAQAGVDPNRKGMDIAQSFGSSSSYARKYALNGLFLIDDTKDADSTNDHGRGGNSAPSKKPLTADVIAKMKAAVAEGKADAVTKALEGYNVTAAQRTEILG